jgi:Tfp pilus assembly protein PilF
MQNAKIEFKKMLKIDSNDIYSNLGLGIVHFKKRNNKIALNYFKKASQIDDNNKISLDYLLLIKIMLENKIKTNDFPSRVARFNYVTERQGCHWSLPDLKLLPNDTV